MPFVGLNHVGERQDVRSVLFKNVARLETVKCLSPSLTRTIGASRKAENNGGTVAPCEPSQCPERGHTQCRISHPWSRGVELRRVRLCGKSPERCPERQVSFVRVKCACLFASPSLGQLGLSCAQLYRRHWRYLGYVSKSIKLLGLKCFVLAFYLLKKKKKSCLSKDFVKRRPSSPLDFLHQQLSKPLL